MSIIVYNEVGTPIIPAGDLAGPVRDALGGALRSMRYVTPDFSGIYQDAAGTTPVTEVGQPVGLMLDRRFGLARGDEIAPQPLDFTDGWSVGTQGTIDGPNTASSAGAGANGVFRNFSLIEGRFYQIEVEVTGLSDGTVGVNNNGSGNASADIVIGLGIGIHRAIFAANNPRLAIRKAQAGTFSIGSLSIRELPGNHASQTTTTARPTLRSSPLRIDYDGVDDYLRTVFPDLGGDVTIARSIPGVGALILTGQTIAAGNWDDNVDSCATLVIDRALTGPETALVTAFLNQQAGV